VPDDARLLDPPCAVAATDLSEETLPEEPASDCLSADPALVSALFDQLIGFGVVQEHTPHTEAQTPLELDARAEGGTNAEVGIGLVTGRADDASRLDEPGVAVATEPLVPLQLRASAEGPVTSGLKTTDVEACTEVPETLDAGGGSNRNGRGQTRNQSGGGLLDVHLHHERVEVVEVGVEDLPLLHPAVPLVALLAEVTAIGLRDIGRIAHGRLAVSGGDRAEHGQDENDTGRLHDILHVC